MKTRTLNIASRDQLIEVTKNIINNLEKDCNLFICGGHFALFYSDIEKKVVPGIYQEMKNPDTSMEILEHLGGFPFFTWRLACNLLDMGVKKVHDSKLILLINDWQQIPNYDLINPSEPNPFRDHFYYSFKVMPKTYFDEFSKYGFDINKNIFRIEKEKFYLRELHLRDRFKRLIKKHKLDINIGQCEYTAGDFSYKDEKLINKGRAGCAGEISQMIYEISKKTENFTLINILPLCCEKAVNTGTELIFDMFKLKPKIYNIFICTQGTITDDDFFNKEAENHNPKICSFED